MEYLKEIFSYSIDQPLLFTHLFFWGFFSFVLLFYSLIYKFQKVRVTYLLLVSLFFYYKTSGIFLVLLIFTIISDYHWGKWIHQTSSLWKKKMFLCISLIINLTFLGFFKYAVFFTESYNQLFQTNYHFFNYFSQFSNEWLGTKFNTDRLILPVGISFFTFQSVSYIMDSYRKDVQPVKNVLDYGFFVCFFPHLVAGPIVKAKEFLHQIYQPYQLSRYEFGLAVFWILNGLSKKILADYLAVNYIDRIFEHPSYYSGLEIIIGILGYSMQIYADFSGYTDIAIGVALLLGFRLRTNFNSPYKAESTSEFWKRWHISLSSWLKDYLYIPLGGNKKGSVGSYLCIVFLFSIMILLSQQLYLFIVLAGISILFAILAWIWPAFRNKVNTNINLMVTMLLGGLWHGSSWMFIIWGGLNGLGLVVHKIWEKINPIRKQGIIYSGVAVFVTLLFISFTRIWFRSDSLETVNTIFYRIRYFGGFELAGKIISSYALVFSVLLFAYLIHWIPEKRKQQYRNFFANLPLPLMILVVVITVFILYQTISGEMQPFIYFQF